MDPHLATGARGAAAGIVVLAASLLAPLSAGAAPACFGQRVTIAGTNGDDRIEGTNGPDVIHGLGGRDVINGLGGDDLVCGGDGGRDPFPKREFLAGGTGDDRIRGEGGVDYVGGGPGDDVVSGGPGEDHLGGGAGADVVRGGDDDDYYIHGDEGRDRLYGGPGDDRRMEGGDGVDTVNGGSGDDYLSGDFYRTRETRELRPDDDLLDGGPGGDWVYSSQWGAKLVADLAAERATGPATGTDELRSIENARGSDAADRLVGDELSNHFSGYGGGDVIEGAGGDDVLEGYGEGAEVYGGEGDDVLFPQPGDDLADGGAGSDTVNLATFTAQFYDPNAPCTNAARAGWAIDLAAGTARHTAFGTEVSFFDVENAIGSPDDDQIAGTDGDNRLRGLCGNDSLDGRGGNDSLTGDGGADVCVNGEEVDGCEP